MSAAVAPDAMSAHQMEISVRACRACVREGILTVGAIRAKGPENMLRLPMIGRIGLREIEAAMGGWASVSNEQLFLADISTPVLVAELARRFPPE